MRGHLEPMKWRGACPTRKRSRRGGRGERRGWEGRDERSRGMGWVWICGQPIATVRGLGGLELAAAD